MKNVAAFKTAKLLFPLFLFETANLKNCPSHFFYVTTTTKGGYYAAVLEKDCQPTPDPDSPDNSWHLSRAAFNWANIWKE